MKSSIWVGLIAMVMGAGVEAQLIFDPAEFSSARSQAEADKHNQRAGCYMECKFDPYFAEYFHPIMGRCFKQVKNPEIKTFTTILQLDIGGNVATSWLDVDTNLSRCAINAVSALSFPAPPFSPYHARLTVNLEP